MPKIPSLLSIGLRELASVTSLVLIALFASSYVILITFLLNYRLVLASESFPFKDRINIFLSLLSGIFTAFSPFDTVLFLCTAVLVGINTLLIIKTLSQLRVLGKLHMSIGGAALVGLFTTGCTSCGLSLLSVLGLGTSIGLLPFHGLELRILSVIFLLFSAFYMLRQLRESIYCKR
ncbi:MAG TPA: hypothetical protein VLB73_03545 [Patescibacteria group bacterium]|nr:hypothetical protein [Patescibacteria group bacterium]